MRTRLARFTMACLSIALLVQGGASGAPPIQPRQAVTPEPAGCISETGSGGSCVDGRALDGATGVAVSPDGASVYIASETSSGVAVFSRDATTGAIGQLEGTAGCVTNNGTAGACADGRALVGPRSIALSPDGENLYFPASGSDAISVLARDGTTGALTQLAGTAGCVSEAATQTSCARGIALDGARGVAVSPDGSSVYVASYFGDAVAVFSRNPADGSLTQLAGTAGCVSETGNGGACADGTALDGPRTVSVSPDGGNVYVASETSGAISVFSRDGATGAITQLAGMDACQSQTGTGGACVQGRALGGAAGVTVSPDGSTVYAASFASDAVTVFARDPATGALTQPAGMAGCVSETGTGGTCADGTALDRARTIAISPDGKNLYVASEESDSLSAFSRDPTTGGLTQLLGTAGCVSETGTSGACSDGTALADARSVVVSPDGRSVYAASFLSSAVSILSRDGETGALTQLGPPAPPPPPPPPSKAQLFLSLRGAATVGGVAVANEDILSIDDGTTFSVLFDGSDVGIAALRIDAFSWLDADSILLSFDAPGSIGGIVGTVDDSDVVRFDSTSLGTSTSGAFTLYLDGSDVGLTNDARDLDAIEVLPDGRLLLSIAGNASVPVAARDEDLVAFTPTSLGEVTAGSFSLSFDGSDVGLGDASEDVDAAAVDGGGGIYLSTLDPFAVSGVSGQDEDVFVFTPSALDPPTTAGSYAPILLFDGSGFGLSSNDVYAIDLP